MINYEQLNKRYRCYNSDIVSGDMYTPEMKATLELLSLKEAGVITNRSTAFQLTVDGRIKFNRKFPQVKAFFPDCKLSWSDLMKNSTEAGKHFIFRLNKHIKLKFSSNRAINVYEKRQFFLRLYFI